MKFYAIAFCALVLANVLPSNCLEDDKFGYAFAARWPDSPPTKPTTSTVGPTTTASPVNTTTTKIHPTTGSPSPTMPTGGTTTLHTGVTTTLHTGVTTIDGSKSSDTTEPAPISLILYVAMGVVILLILVVAIGICLVFCCTRSSSEEDKPGEPLDEVKVQSPSGSQTEKPPTAESPEENPSETAATDMTETAMGQEEEEESEGEEEEGEAEEGEAAPEGTSDEEPESA